MNFTRIFSLFCLTAGLTLAALAASPAPAAAENTPTTIALPAPDKTGGKPLMQALALRHSTRSFTSQTVSEQDLSNLLWAVWGINRDDGRHTAPTAKNKQHIAVYVALSDGVWLYDPVNQALVQYMDKDIRGPLGDAPLILMYAAPADDESAGFHLGMLCQNAGLYCASADLGSVIKVTGADEADKLLALKDNYKVMLIQPVGHPK